MSPSLMYVLGASVSIGFGNLDNLSMDVVLLWTIFFGRPGPILLFVPCEAATGSAGIMTEWNGPFAVVGLKKLFNVRCVGAVEGTEEESGVAEEGDTSNLVGAMGDVSLWKQFVNATRFPPGGDVNVLSN